MPPKPGADLSTTSFIDLKAQLAQHREQFERQRSGNKLGPAAGRIKKKTVWARQNKGVDARARRDANDPIENVESDALQRSREGLERKTRQYQELRTRIRHGSDNEDDEKSELVDFDQKYWQERELEKARAEYEAQRKRKSSSHRTKDQDDDSDPWVEHVDDLGRTRLIRQSQLPSREPSPASSRSPSPERRIPRDPDEFADRSSIHHYEAAREIRTKGVGFYSFSKDEEERATQMQQLNEMRAETETARQSAVHVAERRKAQLAKQAERIRAKRASLQRPQPPTPTKRNTASIPNINEMTVSEFLKSMREKVNTDPK